MSQNTTATTLRSSRRRVGAAWAAPQYGQKAKSPATSFAHPGHWPIGLELQRLRLGELLEPERPELAPDAGLLEATERRRDFERPAVDVDLPGLHLARERL